MTPLDALLPLVSIVIGLAVADLATSLHRLLRARRRVRWDWLPLLTAGLAGLLILNVWWVLAGSPSGERYDSFSEFLPVGVLLGVLFLLAAAALPDDVPPSGLDLRAFYEANRRHFWGLMAAYHVLVVLNRALTAGVAHALEGASNLLLAGAFVALAMVPKRRVHEVAAVGLLLLYVWAWWGLRLGGPAA